MAADKPPADAGLPELRQKITQLVARNAVAMVQCTIDSVMEDGQYQAIKYLFELVGIFPAIAGDTQAPEDTLSRILLRHLGAELPGDAERKTSSEGTSIHPVE